MREICKLTEMVWEFVVRPNKEKGENKPSHLQPTGSDSIDVKTIGSYASQDHTLHRNKTKRGNILRQMDTTTKVHNNCANRGEDTKGQWMAFSDSLADVAPALSGHPRTLSDDSRGVSDYLSELDCSSYSEVYRTEPRIKRTFQPRGYRGRNQISTTLCTLQTKSGSVIILF